MGDMADWCREQEQLDATLHAQGDCDMWCPECAEEDRVQQAATRKRTKKKPPSAAPTGGERGR